MNTKRHNAEAGYICERMNPFVPGEKVVVYIATEQGIDAAGYKYAIVCDAHKTIGGSPNIPDARIVMKNPNNFCEECASLAKINMGIGKPK